jgi:hypothetical protein
MNKLILSALLFLAISSVNIFSQTITFTRIGPETITISDTNAYEGYIYALLNTSVTTNIRLIRTIEDLTSGWQPLGTALCNYQACFPPEADTIIAEYTPAASDDTCSFHFYCRNDSNIFVQGAGHIRVRAELVSNPSTFVELDFRANTPQTIGITQLSTIVKEFTLGQNYPNPFNPVTNINFSIPKSEFVSLRVYDILGREVKALVSQNLTQGEYEVNFDASGLSSGMYYYSLRAGEYVSVKKMVLVK